MRGRLQRETASTHSRVDVKPQIRVADSNPSCAGRHTQAIFKLDRSRHIALAWPRRWRRCEMIIETTGLRKSFRSRKGAVDAVRGVDLAVREGEIFGFLGPNGAGKTTTLRMLATLIEPDGGEATVAGVDLRKNPGEVRRRIGYVAQGGSTWDESSPVKSWCCRPGSTASRRPKPRRAPTGAGRVPAHRLSPIAVQDLFGRPAPTGRHRARHHSRAQPSSSSTSRRPVSIRSRGPTCGMRSVDSATRARPCS